MEKEIDLVVQNCLFTVNLGGMGVYKLIQLIGILQEYSYPHNKVVLDSLHIDSLGMSLQEYLEFILNLKKRLDEDHESNSKGVLEAFFSDKEYYKQERSFSKRD